MERATGTVPTPSFYIIATSGGTAWQNRLIKMKHRYLKLFFAALLCIATTGARAHDFVVNGFFFNITSTTNKTVAITYAFDDFDSFSNEYTGDVIIPESVTYNGTTYSVTSIGDGTFYKCTELTSITIPNSVTSIGSSAFAFCTGLTNITIPNSVTSIGSSAFYNTAWYNDQPDGIVYAGKVLYEYKGAMPENTSIVINDGTLGIAGGAFYGCTGLTNIEIPNSVTNIGNEAFVGCNSIENIDIKDGTETLILGNGGYQAGESGVRGLFSSQYNLKTLYLGRNLQYQVGYNYLDKYNYYAPFHSLKNLKNITIGNNVTDIGEGLFLGCTNISCVINFSNLWFSKGSTGYGYIAYHANRVVNAKNGFIEGEYVFTTNNTYFLAGYIGNDTIPTLPMYCKNEKYGIGGKAFADCNWITSINIPNSVTSIEESAFSGCTGLTNIEIPNSVTNIGNSAFSGCTGLTSIEIPNSVTNIGSSAFNGCTGLKSVKIGNGITNIEYGTFNGCSALTNLYIEDGDSILTLHGLRSYTEGTGLFNSAPLQNLYIGRELEFETERYYGYSPFYSKDIDTITISKKPKRNLRFGGGSKFITILYIDNYSYNPYSEVVPQYQISENTTVRYFKTPYSESFFDNINCIKVPLGEITSDYHSISVTLNDSLIGKHIVKAGGMLKDATVEIDGNFIQATANDIYCLDGLKIGTDYPVTLRYVYDGTKYTTATTISTKNISPEPTIYCNQTLSTATIKLSVGDTIGLGAPIDEIGIIYNGENLPAERDEILNNLHRITISNLRPGHEYYYNIYFKIGTEYYRGSKSFEFSTKSPSIAIIKNLNTQTTSSIKIIGSFSDEHLAPSRVGAYFYDNGYHEYSADEDNNILIEGLKPYTTYYITPFVEYEEFGRYSGETKEITTDSIGIGCAATATATTITLEGTYEVGDATLIEHGFVEGEANISNRVIIGLDPDTEYSFTYYVTTEEGGTVQTLVTARTEQLTFNTLRAKATSNTRAVICAEANIANEEAGTGFEWRRIDAPDLVPSEIVSCAVHEGVMEGALHNLSANTYYKYRPYYTAASGKSYYGEWIGFGTADAYVYFTPTVHTYATASAGTNAARLSGYVLAGSDDIIEQGFEYWPVGKAEVATMHNTHSDGNVRRVTATGQRMSVIIEELEYGTIYMCRAYARTTKETVYGEEQSFETSFPTGIEENREKNITIQTAGNTVYINGYNENETVFVYTLFGAVVYNGPEKEITLNSGTYIVKVGNITKKIQIR